MSYMVHKICVQVAGRTRVRMKYHESDENRPESLVVDLQLAIFVCD